MARTNNHYKIVCTITDGGPPEYFSQKPVAFLLEDPDGERSAYLLEEAIELHETLGIESISVSTAFGRKQLSINIFEIDKANENSGGYRTVDIRDFNPTGVALSQGMSIALPYYH
jgi:hypothetical protein